MVYFFSSHCSEKHGKHSRDALANNSRCSIAMQYWEGRQASNKKSEVENIESKLWIKLSPQGKKTKLHASAGSVNSGGSHRPKQISYPTSFSSCRHSFGPSFNHGSWARCGAIEVSSVKLQGMAWRHWKTTVNVGRSYFIIPWAPTLRLSSNFPQIELRSIQFCRYWLHDYSIQGNESGVWRWFRASSAHPVFIWSVRRSFLQVELQQFWGLRPVRWEQRDWWCLETLRSCPPICTLYLMT